MTETILVVDDSLTIRMDLTEALIGAGFRVVPCATAAEARASLSSQSPDLAVLDVMLPDGDGVELLKEIRSDRRTAGTIVLMLSSEAEVADRVRGLRTGADEYVGKPYEIDYVLAKIHELLRCKRSGSREAAGVLIVDDSETYREELRSTFESAGHFVVTAAGAEEGLRLAAQYRPIAMVVDGQMPGMDGPAMIRRVRLDAALRHIPCLLLTASADDASQLRALDAGADSFMRKGTDTGVILARLNALVRAAGASPAGEAAASLFGGKRILAVGAGDAYRRQLAETLNGEGYDVILARSGEEALDLLAVQQVDCILLDLEMRGLGGRETCRRIKEAPVTREIPLIIVSPLETRDAMIESLAAGADDFIAESSEMSVLKARVRAQIRRKQTEDENRRVREEILLKELEASEARAARQLAEARGALLEEIERKNKELERVNSELNDFARVISHDLKQPLRGIGSIASWLAEDYAEKLEEAGRKQLDLLISRVQRMSALIDGVLEYSRAGRGNEDGVVDVVAVVRDVIDALSAPPHVTLRVGGNLPPVKGDRVKLGQVFQNLVGNAVRYADKPRGEIEIGFDGEDGSFFVRDNGPGIREENVSRIFEMFETIPVGDVPAGTGVGLAIVKKIVEGAGGAIRVESTVGSGSTFRFTLPLAPPGERA